jgi:hydroxymethylpyrimidine pyrophosphatase-like HAD family hydrolase
MQWIPTGWVPKAVAVDIDGTITDSNKVIHLDAIAALRRLEDAGITVILATGNIRAITYGLWRFIGATGPMEAWFGTQTGVSRLYAPMVRERAPLDKCLKIN